MIPSTELHEYGGSQLSSQKLGDRTQGHPCLCIEVGGQTNLHKIHTERKFQVYLILLMKYTKQPYGKWKMKKMFQGVQSFHKVITMFMFKPWEANGWSVHHSRTLMN